MTKFNLKELILLKDFATQELLKLPGNCKLEGMNRSLTDGEKVALSYYRASLRTLSSAGAIKKEWLEEEDSAVVTSDSDPDAEY